MSDLVLDGYVRARSCANIALAKYWGKTPGRRPQDANLPAPAAHNVPAASAGAMGGRGNNGGDAPGVTEVSHLHGHWRQLCATYQAPRCCTPGSTAWHTQRRRSPGKRG